MGCLRNIPPTRSLNPQRECFVTLALLVDAERGWGTTMSCNQISGIDSLARRARCCRFYGLIRSDSSNQAERH